MKNKKTPMNRSENMSRIRSKDTSIEIILRKELWKRGYRYRKNCKNIFGKPDICFKKKKIAVFCDSEFWHGKDFLEGRVPKSNQEYWIPKIKRNIERDKEVTETLQLEGWIVIRIWGKEILKNTSECANMIESYLN